jgi:hypothetical protein
MQQFTYIMRISQTSQCDAPRKTKPTPACDLDHAGFREGNYVKQKSDKDIKTK